MILTAGKPTWEFILDGLGRSRQETALKSVLKTRKRHIHFDFNGSSVLVKRAAVRDYLKTVVGGDK